jgi:hypothetical protein
VGGMLNAASTSPTSSALLNSKRSRACSRPSYERHFAHKEFTHWGDKMVVARLRPRWRLLRHPLSGADPRSARTSSAPGAPPSRISPSSAAPHAAQASPRCGCAPGEIGASLRVVAFVVRYEDLVRTGPRRPRRPSDSSASNGTLRPRDRRHATFASVAPPARARRGLGASNAGAAPSWTPRTAFSTVTGDLHCAPSRVPPTPA